MIASRRAAAQGWFLGPLMAGFECTSYLRRDGVRLDVQAQTGHDSLAEQDYRLVARHGMRCVRDGVPWHRIEPIRGRFDWSIFENMIAAADGAGVRVMWDLLHFGWPDWVDPTNAEFVERFAIFGSGVAERCGESDAFVPVNEISFLTWAAGEVGFMHPFLNGKGNQLKLVLCSAFIAATAAIRSVKPNAIIACAEPLIAVHPCASQDEKQVKIANEVQFEALDILLGRNFPELGGYEDIVDVIGLNHYPHSQWQFPSMQAPLAPEKLSTLLQSCAVRYGHPLFLSETGAEGGARAPWFRYVCLEVEKARADGLDIRSVCLYPILNHLGWEDDRYCPNGLFCGMERHRPPHEPLAIAISDFLATDRHQIGVSALADV